MEPSNKRARLSSGEVEDGPSPPSLFDLSLKAMTENAKSGIYPIETHKLSPLITAQIWKKSSLLDIIENLCNPGTYELYSNRVIKPPTFTVTNNVTWIGNQESGQECDLNIEFDDGRSMKWTLKTFNPEVILTHLRDHKLSFRTGDKMTPTQLLNETENYLFLASNISDSWNSRFGMIKWLTKAFRCKIDEIKFENDLKYHFNDLNKWDQLETVRSLHIDECDNLEWLQTILPVRNERNLKTSVRILYCLQPLPLHYLKIIDVSRIDSNLSSLKQDDLIEYAITALKCCKERVKLKLPNWNSEQVKIFESRLNLSDGIKSLNENNEPTGYRVKEFKAMLYSMNGNNIVFAYYFFEKPPGVFKELFGSMRKIKQGRA